MSLQFIYGSSGSGKSSYIFYKIVEEAGADLRKNYYVVVPEQFTMQTQRELVRIQKKHGIMNVDVVSFQRLAYRVFDELGMTNLSVLEETGKSLVLRKIAADKKDELKVLQGNMKKMGYIGEVKSLISELAQYNIKPEDLDNFLTQTNVSPAFAYKMQDVLTMYEGFREYIEGTYITAEEVLEVFRDVAEQSELLKGAVLVFDGFTGFTPVQNNLLMHLMELVGQIYVTVTIDQREDPYSYHDMQELFAMSKKTVKTLLEMADTVHCEVLEPVILENTVNDRFTDAPTLRFLEQNIFRTRYQTIPYRENMELMIASVSNPKQELAFVAAKIAGLVSEKGYRYKDIAVISGAVEAYGNYVPQVFDAYEIPYFLDTTKDILLHPFIEFIRATLQVMEEGFSYEAMFRYLRCGLTEIAEEEIDRLENYVLATGIRGLKKWTARFAILTRGMTEEELESLNAIRIRVIEPFEPLWETVRRKDATVQEVTIALYQFIVSFRMEQKLKERENEYTLARELTKAKEYAQIYRIVMDLLDKLTNLLGEEVMPLDEYAKILDAGFEAAKVGVIPSGYDRVMVGDIERSRLDQVKVLFLVGVNDGIIPKADARGGIISQLEREEMAKHKLELAPTARERVFIQRFYLYLALTKPSCELYLTYARVNSDGEAIRSSYLIGMVEKLFPGIRTRYIDDMAIYTDLVTARSSKSFLLEGLQKDQNFTREQEAQWEALVRWYHEQEQYDNPLRKLLKGAESCYQEEAIGRSVARALYGSVLTNSVTRLEQYAACACAHFLSYGLGLREREMFEFQMVDMGNIYHLALEKYAKALEHTDATWFDVSEEQQNALCEQALQDAIAQEAKAALADNARNRYQADRMLRILKRTIWALTRQIRQGSFTPSDFEVAFAFADELEAANFKLSEEECMKLRGRIDRVDTYETKDKLYVKIVDYKSGNTSFELLSLYHGLQLQLVVYMNAAMELLGRQHPDKQTVPAGMFYYHIDDPMVDGTGKETETEIYDKVFEQLRMDGIVNTTDEAYRTMDHELSGKSKVIPLTVNKDGSVRSSDKAVDADEFALISDYSNHVIGQAGESIISGDTAVRPYELKERSSCTYCPYAAICGYDEKIPGFHRRKLAVLKAEEIYEKMKEVTE